MKRSRRRFLGTVGALTATLGGCLGRVRETVGDDQQTTTANGRTNKTTDGRQSETADGTTDDHAITDVSLQNQTGASRTVHLKATNAATDETVLDRRIDLAADGTEGSTVEFANPFADDTEYDVTVEVSGFDAATYHWSGETDDNEGILVWVESDGISIRGIQH